MGEAVTLTGFSATTRLPTTAEAQAFMAHWTDGTYISLYNNADYWVACGNPGATPYPADYVKIGNAHAPTRGTSRIATDSSVDPATLIPNYWPNNQVGLQSIVMWRLSRITK